MHLVGSGASWEVAEDHYHACDGPLHQTDGADSMPIAWYNRGKNQSYWVAAVSRVGVFILFFSGYAHVVFCLFDFDCSTDSHVVFCKVRKLLRWAMKRKDSVVQDISGCFARIQLRAGTFS